jgi:uncharacterized membrane protein HdeD (DUF308 family)
MGVLEEFSRLWERLSRDQQILLRGIAIGSIGVLVIIHPEILAIPILLFAFFLLWRNRA